MASHAFVFFLCIGSVIVCLAQVAAGRDDHWTIGGLRKTVNVEKQDSKREELSLDSVVSKTFRGLTTNDNDELDSAKEQKTSTMWLWRPPQQNERKAIYGGSRAAAEDYKFLVALYKSDGSFHCGGSLIDEFWVLTAAHCVDETSYVVLGMYDRIKQTGLERRDIKERISHPYYNPFSRDLDVGLIKLTEKSSMPTVSLNKYEHKPELHANLNVVGWGETEQGELSRYPLEATVTYMEHTECKKQGFETIVSSSMMCALGTNSDSCQGDSGGPLVRGDEGTIVLFGIVSWGRGCGDGYPGVYVRVSAVHEWIQEQIGLTEDTFENTEFPQDFETISSAQDGNSQLRSYSIPQAQMQRQIHPQEPFTPINNGEENEEENGCHIECKYVVICRQKCGQ